MLLPTAANALYPATPTSSDSRRHQIVAMRCDVVVTPRVDTSPCGRTKGKGYGNRRAQARLWV